MIIISYDIANTKLRTQFSRYICRYGHRIQYSVYEIDHSEKVLDNIINDIKNKFEKKFQETDSIYIFRLSKTCKIDKFGYAKHEDYDIIISV